MAPPRNRRQGFSRRVQMSLFIGYVAAIVCGVLGIGVVLIGRLDPVGYRLLRGAALDISAPVTGLARRVVMGISGANSAVSAYIDAGSKNEALHRELADARRKLIDSRKLTSENDRLRQLLHLVETERRTVVVSRIVGSSPTAPRRLATLSAGTSDGVAAGQPVISVDGLVGRVIEIGHAAARVLLITDTESAVPVRMAGSGTPALATGRGDGTIALRGLVAGGRAFRPGDVALTSSTGGLFPPDVPVAVVLSGDSDSAIARPLADPTQLDFVTVQQPYQEEVVPKDAIPAAAGKRP